MASKKRRRQPQGDQGSPEPARARPSVDPPTPPAVPKPLVDPPTPPPPPAAPIPWQVDPPTPVATPEPSVDPPTPPVAPGVDPPTPPTPVVPPSPLPRTPESSPVGFVPDRDPADNDGDGADVLAGAGAGAGSGGGGPSWSYDSDDAAAGEALSGSSSDSEAGAFASDLEPSEGSDHGGMDESDDDGEPLAGPDILDFAVYTAQAATRRHDHRYRRKLYLAVLPSTLLAMQPLWPRPLHKVTSAWTRVVCCHGAGSIAAAAEARAVVVPAGAGAPQPPDVPLPVRGGTATRAERILPPPPGPLPAGCITKYLEEGKLITRFGSNVLHQSGVCIKGGPPTLTDTRVCVCLSLADLVCAPLLLAVRAREAEAP